MSIESHCWLISTIRFSNIQKEYLNKLKNLSIQEKLKSDKYFIYYLDLIGDRGEFIINPKFFQDVVLIESVSREPDVICISYCSEDGWFRLGKVNKVDLLTFVTKDKGPLLKIGSRLNSRDNWYNLTVSDVKKLINLYYKNKNLKKY